MENNLELDYLAYYNESSDLVNTFFSMYQLITKQINKIKLIVYLYFKITCHLKQFN